MIPVRYVYSTVQLLSFYAGSYVVLFNDDSVDRLGSCKVLFIFLHLYIGRFEQSFFRCDMLMSNGLNKENCRMQCVVGWSRNVDNDTR